MRAREGSAVRVHYHARRAAALVVCAALIAALGVARAAQGAKATPVFLVATPGLLDPLFAHSVILMLPPTASPLIAGVIINKPTTIRVRALFPNTSALKTGSEKAYFGGPVSPTEPSLIVRAPQPSAKTSRLFDDLYLSTDPGSIVGFLTTPGSVKDLRLFLGRAQWTRDQLHNEILRGSWYVARAEAKMVFDSDPEGVWRALVHRAQLQEVEATQVAQPVRFVLFRCGGGALLHRR